jgi:SAM-dependent methyltransferase
MPNSFRRSNSPRLCIGKCLNAVYNLFAHSGGGITDNLPRILPAGLGALIRKGSWPVLPVFDFIQHEGGVDDAEMYRTFNMGIGMIIAVPAKQADAVIKKAGIKAGNVVLDIGCGTGFLIVGLVKSTGVGGKVVGVDISEEMMKKAKENLSEAGVSNVEFKVGDAENIPLGDASVDVQDMRKETRQLTKELEDKLSRSGKELDDKLTKLNKEVDNKIQKALDNPLAK